MKKYVIFCCRGFFGSFDYGSVFLLNCISCDSNLKDGKTLCEMSSKRNYNNVLNRNGEKYEKNRRQLPMPKYQKHSPKYQLVFDWVENATNINS